MGCWLPLVASVCIADPAEFYIDSKLHVASVRAPWGQGLNKYDRHSPMPLGELAIGMRVRLSDTITVGYGLAHRSSIPVNDQGDDTLFWSLTWRPFGGAR